MTNNFTNGRKRPTNFTNFMKSILSAARNRLRFLFEKFDINSLSVRSLIDFIHSCHDSADFKQAWSALAAPRIREIREIRGRKNNLRNLS